MPFCCGIRSLVRNEDHSSLTRKMLSMFSCQMVRQIWHWPRQQALCDIDTSSSRQSNHSPFSGAEVALILMMAQPSITGSRCNRPSLDRTTSLPLHSPDVVTARRSGDFCSGMGSSTAQVSLSANSRLPRPRSIWTKKFRAWHRCSHQS